MSQILLVRAPTFPFPRKAPLIQLLEAHPQLLSYSGREWATPCDAQVYLQPSAWSARSFGRCAGFKELWATAAAIAFFILLPSLCQATRILAGRMLHSALHTACRRRCATLLRTSIQLTDCHNAASHTPSLAEGNAQFLGRSWLHSPVEWMELSTRGCSSRPCVFQSIQQHSSAQPKIKISGEACSISNPSF